ncbi:MAG TPA: accessory factor UbiK family protein [Burkholderiales bacterium]|nr:accessory factor UbiK family protein [Burkholderiales bacterium]
MIDNKFWDELSARLREIIATGPAHDIEKNLRALLSSTFARMHLVTREEFDAQSAVLAHTRAKLENLEKQLAGIERQRRAGD